MCENTAIDAFRTFGMLMQANTWGKKVTIKRTTVEEAIEKQRLQAGNFAQWL